MLQHQKYQHYLCGNGGFWEEFDVLQQWETKRDSRKDIGFLNENKSKNRYRNILPCMYFILFLLFSYYSCNIIEFFT